MGKKTVGLASGGKDSIFALHWAREMGHPICAVATLLPRDNLVEADSYMYQSVGTAVTSAVAECLGVPHFCASVRGRPINTEHLNYETTAGDEVEDLYDLLSQVKQAVPGLEAVTCGAILSEFQRRRVEHVCQRLGLVPISLLWNRQQEDLLCEMVEWGLHAVLVKTASMGLSRKHLGGSVSDLLPHFIALHKKHGFHVCGEGGEYETLTLDCPLFQKGSIVVSDWQEICHADDPFAPVYLLSPLAWVVQPKDSSAASSELQADTEKLNAVELRRFQPYVDQIRAAIKGWSSGCDDAKKGGPAMSGAKDSTPKRIEHTTEASRVVAGLSRSHEWKVQVQSSSVGCMLNADVLVCSFDDLRRALTSDTHGNISLGFKDSIRRTVGQWLGRQLKGSFSDSHMPEGGSLIQTICQVAHPVLISIVKELFADNHVEPHPVTFIVTPLPHQVILRMRMSLSCSNTPTSPTALLWKSPAVDAVLHVHSLNWWLPPCSSGSTGGLEGKRSESLCCSCQGVRCEPFADGASSVARVFLRGCDGRYPHTGLLPDPKANRLLNDLAGQAEGAAISQQVIHVVLQAVNSFLNMEQALRMAQSGGSSDGFLGAAYNQVKSEPSDPERPLDLAEFPPIILVFVKLDQATAGMTTEAGCRPDRSLSAVKELVNSLVKQNYQKAGDLRSTAQEERPCIVVAAGVADLPEDALAMVQPLWSTARRRGEAETFCTISSIERVQLREFGWKETATALACRRVAASIRHTPTEEMSDTCSSFVCTSFGALECELHQSSSSFGEDFYSVIDRTLQKYSSLETSVQSDERQAKVLEVLVFYSVSWARSLWTDAAACEAALLEKITRACSQKSAALLQLPAVTFFPVNSLAGGFLELLFCFIS
ncbi:hypothetical protein Esti_000746 [Eimeria stiedai]